MSDDTLWPIIDTVLHQVSINTVNTIDVLCSTSAYLCPVYFCLMILFLYHILDHWLVLVDVVQRVPLHSPHDPRGPPVALVMMTQLQPCYLNSG